MPDDLDEDDDLSRRIRQGDHPALTEFYLRDRDRLRRMVRLRLDRRLQGKVDPSDVLQEAYLDAMRRLPKYAANPEMPPFLWLRFLTAQRLTELHRRHLGTKMREAGREISLHQGAFPAADSRSLANRLLGRLTTPSRAAIRAEVRVRIQEALDAMDPIDREVLALRHFEELDNNETARVLGLQKAAASNRYVRSLRRLKEILSTLPGLLDEPGVPPRPRGPGALP